MKRILSIVFILLLILVSPWLYNLISRNLEPREVVSIKPRLSGPMLGGVENNGLFEEHSLFPCANSESDVWIYLLQAISYSKSHIYPPDKVPLPINLSEIKSTFTIQKIKWFYQVTKLNSTYDKYLQTTENVRLEYPAPNKWYICDANTFAYLNTEYGNKYAEVYYPYDIDNKAFTDKLLKLEERELTVSYLNNSSLGITRIVQKNDMNKDFLMDFSDFLYENGYFGVFEKIISRNISLQNRNLVITDITKRGIMSAGYSPFEKSSYKCISKVIMSTDTGIVTSEFHCDP